MPPAVLALLRRCVLSAAPGQQQVHPEGDLFALVCEMLVRLPVGLG